MESVDAVCKFAYGIQGVFVGPLKIFTGVAVRYGEDGAVITGKTEEPFARPRGFLVSDVSGRIPSRFFGGFNADIRTDEPHNVSEREGHEREIRILLRCYEGGQEPVKVAALDRFERGMGQAVIPLELRYKLMDRFEVHDPVFIQCLYEDQILSLIHI